MTSVSLSKAKKQFSELVKDIAETTRPIIISVHGRNQAVLISMEEYESLMETIEILKDEALVKKIASSTEDIRKENILKFDRIRGDR